MKTADLRGMPAPIITWLIALTAFIVNGGCDKTEPTPNLSPTCSITNPKNGEELLRGEIRTLSVEASDADGTVTGVVFEIDHVRVDTSHHVPYQYSWNTLAAGVGQHKITITAIDNGNKESSYEISVTIADAPSSVSDSGTVIDYDGNTYKTVKIGTQWWMAENLKTTHYANGAEIPLVENEVSWANLGYSDKAFCYYNDSIAYAGSYGAIYSWSAAMNGAESSETVPSYVQGVCPTGWHVPSDEEWIALEMELGMSHDEAWLMSWRGSNEGTKMKAKEGWDFNGNGVNSSGFSALPAGIRSDNGLFSDEGLSTHFWSTTEYINNAAFAFNRQLDYNHSGVGWFYASHYYGFPKDYGFSVRCVKD